MAYLINDKTISIQDSRSKSKELINNNNNEDVCEVSQKEKDEEKKTEEIGFESRESKCDDLYHKQYTRKSNNNVQSYQCDIKQYDKPNHREMEKCDRQDEVFIQETNNRKYEKNEYCEQFSESSSSVDEKLKTCKNNSKDTTNPTHGSSNQTSSHLVKDNVRSTQIKTTESINHVSNYKSTNTSSISKALYSTSTSNSLSPKIHRIEKATSVSNSSSRSNSERSFKYETSPKRNSRESSVASSSSRNSLTCDRKPHGPRNEGDMSELTEEMVEKWVMTNASTDFIDRLIKLKQNERTRREIQEDQQSSAKMGRRNQPGFSSLETMSSANESSSNVSNSIESVSSYNDPMASCMDLTLRTSASTCNKRTSVTSDLFNLWISNSPIKRCKSPNR